MDRTAMIFRIAKIIANEKLGNLSTAEDETLQAWLAADTKNRELYHELRDDKKLAEVLKETDRYDAEKHYDAISRIINPAPKGKVVILRHKWTRIAAAVAFLVAGSFIAYALFIRKDTSRQMIGQIEPGTQKAVLTTSDNRIIMLGGLKQKAVFTDRNVTIIDTGSTLTYRAGSEADAEVSAVAFNQLETPRGGEYALILPDGSTVKLNSQSRIRFPVSFNKRSREVELEGEAFFEVARSDEIPFTVSTRDMEITVYGTSFNVSAYDEDSYIQATLVRGSVGISLPGAENQVELILVPGQQAHYNKALNALDTKEVNTTLYTAWTKGLFVFENEPLEQILQKLARWYDCEVEFSDAALKTEPFTGELERYDTITKILELISIASDVGFRVEGRKVIVVSEK